MTIATRRPLAAFALAPQGADLARRLAQALDADLYLPRRFAAPDEAGFDSLAELVPEVFRAYRGHLFVAACGIVVRLLAPLLRDKDTDPGVVVLDQEGRFAVSLLSGHLGGGNDLARRAAAVAGGQAVITTATDTAGLPSLDLLARDSGLAIVTLKAVKTVNAALLEGRAVQVFDPEGLLRVPPEHAGRFEWLAAPHLMEPGAAGVVVSWRASLGRSGPDSSPAVPLHLTPRRVVAGVGCRKDSPVLEIVEAVLRALEQGGAARESLAALASIEAKRDEPGLIEAARRLGADMLFYSAGELADIPVPNPSPNPLKHVGVESVCEAAALKATGAVRLLLPKTKTPRITVALALRP